MTPSLLKPRNLPAIGGSIIAQVTNDIEKGWKDMHSLLEKISNMWKSRTGVEACFAISVRFKGEGGGGENETYVLRFASFCELLRRPLTSGVTSQNVEGRTETSLKVNCFYTDMKKLHLHWLNKSVMLYQCTVHGGLWFSVQGPRATDFFF